MRQNPMFQQKGQGGRSMPAWFSQNLVPQSRIGAPSPTPPPLPAEPPPEESDYEEIDHLPKNPMKKGSSRRACSLCGNPNPAVSCEMCNNQIFCGSCNDMYHRHPKRQHHSRKILEPLLDNRPPIPPKTPIPPEMMQAQLPPLPPSHPPYPPPSSNQGAGVPTPQPPPRRKGRFGMRSAAGSPTSSGGIKSFFDPVGTLKKFMGGMAHRPLPSPPKAPPPLPPKPADLGRCMTPTLRGPMIGERRLHSPQPGAFPQDDRRGGMPMGGFEMHNARMHSISVANLSGHTNSRDSGYPDWEEDDEPDFFSRNRAQSVSGGVLGRFPTTSQDASHFATLHRPGRNQRQAVTQSSTTSLSSGPQSSSLTGSDLPPERPPPPLPPRQFPSQTQLAFQSSQSVFDLDRMAAVAQQQNAAAFGMPPWNYPVPGYPFDFQQAMMMGYPGGGTMHRTPSTQSMGPSMNPSAAQQQQFFGWNPMGFGPPMSQMEMEMMTRRGSEQFMNMLPPQQQQMSQRSVPLSNPVTPQGSFRKKTGRHMSVEPELTRRLDNRSGLDIGHHRRSGTPSSFVRVPQSSSTSSTPAPLTSSTSAFVSTQKPIKPPAKPPSNSDQSPDDSYFSAERQQLTESSESTPELTENPEGPWECEHCTFINPKSTKVCTVCCKTPSAGYIPMKGKRGAPTKGRLAKKPVSEKSSASIASDNSQASGRRRDSSKESATSTGTDELVPVLKSKLSISRDQKQQPKINLVSKVEKERVKKSSLKTGSSGTLKAGTAPPAAVKAAALGAKKKSVKAKSKPISDSDEEEEDEEEEDEEVIAEPVEDDDQEEYDVGGSGESKEDEEEEEEEEEEEREQKSEDENADDEENVVNVKITAGNSKLSVRTGRQLHTSSTAAKKASTSAAKTRPVRGRSTSRGPSVASQNRRLVDSNEDVYGSVPIQTLAISPKIEIKRSSKSKSSTVGTPLSPKLKTDSGTGPSESDIGKSTSPTVPTQENQSEFANAEDFEKESEPKKPVKTSTSEEINKATGPETEQPVTVSITASSGKPKKKKGTGKVKKAVEPAPEEIAKETNKNDEEEKSLKPQENAVAEESPQRKRKNSVGTSPPPQSISTQTNEDARISDEVKSVITETVEPVQIASPMLEVKSSSKTSLKSDTEPYFDPTAARHNIEMSEKAMMRYARKTRNKDQHYQKLKRSLSTQLTYPGVEPWMEGEGKHLYRSSSRQSLASDTRSLPMSGPPSRESSPTAMSRYGIPGGERGSSRGGWYDEFRRYPPPASMWNESRYGMPPENFFASIDDLMSRKGRRESMRSQEFELTRMLKDAEEHNFSPEDVQVGIRMCGDKNPIKWLQENWASMIETVQSLATKYGREKGMDGNDVGTISVPEAKEAIRSNRGNVWAAVTDCVDQRRKKYQELESRGTFLREDILTALTANHGNLEAAYVELSKAQLKPFLMRIWGDAGNQEATEDAQQPDQPSYERSSSLPGQPSVDDTKKPKKSRKTSLIAGKSSHVSTDDLRNPPKQLEKLVSNAEKVTQEIEKAIQELKRSNVSVPSVTDDDLEADESPVAPIQKDESKDSFHTGDGGSVQIKSESESELSAAHFVKSDDGDDESFADAVSEAVSVANSPAPQNEPEADANDQVVLPAEINNNTINVGLHEDGTAEEEFDEDVLEIDDTEANISEFIQNYEIVPAKEPEENEEGEEEDDEHEADGEIDESAPEMTESVGPPEDKNITKGEIEKLMTALTSTFSEMEQFAYKIKENIASEIQQQLAAAKKSSGSTSHDHSEDGSYEPIALPPAVEESVNKKVAKYQRLAAKKNVLRHKSPETSNFLLGQEEKEPSLSPLPSTSIVKEIDNVIKTKKKKIKKIKEGASEDKVEILTEKVADDAKPVEKEQPVEQVEEEVEERPTTGESRDFEEVEIDQEDLQIVDKEEDVGEEEDDDGMVEVEEEEVEEVSEEDIVIEGVEEVEEEEEEEEEDVGGDGGDIYANVEMNTEGMSITPSDTDKVIVSGANLAAAAKTIRKHNVAANANDSKSVVIVTEDLTEQQQKAAEEEKTETAVVTTGQPEKEQTPAEKLVAEGKTENLYQSELALQLLEMNFSEDDALSAAKECSSLCSALSFLQQECDLCTGKFSAREMVSMIHCTHLCCRNCARDYFTVQVRDKTIVDATCPFCGEPSSLSDDAEQATEYFNHLDILLKNLLDTKHHEMFQRKLRDWTLAKTPNFKWCSKCSSGFITEPLQTRLVCPDCKAVTCAVCMETWDKTNHDHRDDSASSSVKLCDTTPKSIIEYLNANHIECPRCHFRFSLARGGCMHLTCTQCHHEFCSGCAAPFRMGDKCEAKYPICDKLGLHAHHPRNCLFYLRDKEPDVLAKLLEENAIPYFKENSGEAQIVEREVSGDDPDSENAQESSKAKVVQRVCQVPIQKETGDGYVDDICGKEAPEGYATVCKIHYIEYLGLLITQNHLDPITILTNDDLEVIVRRAFKKHPGRPNWLSDELFRKRLLKVINDEIPL